MPQAMPANTTIAEVDHLAAANLHVLARANTPEPARVIRREDGQYELRIVCHDLNTAYECIDSLVDDWTG